MISLKNAVKIGVVDRIGYFYKYGAIIKNDLSRGVIVGYAACYAEAYKWVMEVM